MTIMAGMDTMAITTTMIGVIGIVSHIMKITPVMVLATQAMKSTKFAC